LVCIPATWRAGFQPARYALLAYSRVSTHQHEKLIEQVSQLCQTKHFSPRTEEAYTRWIVRFLRYHRDRTGVWMRREGSEGPSSSRPKCASSIGSVERRATPPCAFSPRKAAW